MDATEIAAEITEVLFQARGRRSEFASRLPLCAVDAGVPLEVLLRNPVEGERSNRARQDEESSCPMCSGSSPSR